MGQILFLIIAVEFIVILANDRRYKYEEKRYKNIISGLEEENFRLNNKLLDKESKEKIPENISERTAGSGAVNSQYLQNAVAPVKYADERNPAEDLVQGAEQAATVQSPYTAIKNPDIRTAEPADKRQPNPAGIRQAKERINIAEQIKNVRNTRISAVLSLCLGAVFIILAGLVFATTTWKILPDFGKLAGIAMFAVMLYISSYIAHSRLRIFQTAKTFYILASIYLFVSVIAAGYFELLGSGLSLRSEGRYLLYFFGMMLTEISLLYGLKIFREKWYGFVCSEGLGICILLLVYTFSNELQSLIIAYALLAVFYTVVDISGIIKKLPEHFTPVKETFELFSFISIISANIIVLLFAEKSNAMLITTVLLAAVSFALMVIRKRLVFLLSGALLSIIAVYRYINFGYEHLWMYRMIVLDFIALLIRAAYKEAPHSGIHQDAKAEAEREAAESSADIAGKNKRNMNESGLIREGLKYISYIACFCIGVSVFSRYMNTDALDLTGAFIFMVNVFALCFADCRRRLNILCSIALYAFLSIVLRYAEISYENQSVLLTAISFAFLVLREAAGEKLFTKTGIVFTDDYRLGETAVFACNALITEFCILMGEYRSDAIGILYALIICVFTVIIHGYVLKIRQSLVSGATGLFAVYFVLDLFSLSAEQFFIIWLIVSMIMIFTCRKSVLSRYISIDFEMLFLAVCAVAVTALVSMGAKYELSAYTVFAAVLILCAAAELHYLYYKNRFTLIINIALVYNVFVILRFAKADLDLLPLFSISQSMYILSDKLIKRFIKADVEGNSVKCGFVISAFFGIIEFLFMEMTAFWWLGNRETLVFLLLFLISMLLMYGVYRMHFTDRNSRMIIPHFILLPTVFILGNILEVLTGFELKHSYFAAVYILGAMAYRVYIRHEIDIVLLGISAVCAAFTFPELEREFMIPYIPMSAAYIGITLYVRKIRSLKWDCIWISCAWAGTVLQIMNLEYITEVDLFISAVGGLAVLGIIRAGFMKAEGREYLSEFFGNSFLIVSAILTYGFYMELSERNAYGISTGNFILYYWTVLLVLLFALHIYQYIFSLNRADFIQSIFWIFGIAEAANVFRNQESDRIFILTLIILTAVLAVLRILYDIVIQTGIKETDRDKEKTVYKADWLSILSAIPVLMLLAGISGDFYILASVWLAAYILQYRCLNRFRQHALAAAVFFITAGFAVQTNIRIGNLWREEYYAALILIFTESMTFIYPEKRGGIRPYQNTVYTLCLIALGLSAAYNESLANSIVYILISITLLVSGIVFRNRWLRNAGFIAALIYVLYSTRQFWLSFGWWIMLLAVGIILIAFAATNERRKK